MATFHLATFALQPKKLYWNCRERKRVNIGGLRTDKGSWGRPLCLDKCNESSGNYDNTVYIF